MKYVHILAIQFPTQALGEFPSVPSRFKYTLSLIYDAHFTHLTFILYNTRALRKGGRGKRGREVRGEEWRGEREMGRELEGGGEEEEMRGTSLARLE